MSRKALIFRIFFIIAGLLLIFSSSATGTKAQEELIPGQELLKSGDFSDELKFNLYTESGGNAALSIENGELQVDVSKIGRVSHAIQPYYDGFRLYEGVAYLLTFDAHASIDRDLFVRIQLNGGDYHAYFEQAIRVTGEMQHFNFSFVMREPTDPAPRLCINMGFTDAMSGAGLNPEDIEPHRVWFDNFSLTVKDVSGLITDGEDSKPGPIRINQVGYLTDAVKTAVIADLDADSFKVVRSPHGGTVFEGTLSDPVVEASSGETVRIADFTGLKMVGKYKIITSDGTVSPEFPVSRQPFEKLLREALRMLYLQRCGTDLTEEYAGNFAHPVCHSDPAVVYETGQRIDVSGGWHDAGDYGRYVVSGAKAAADLLLSWEMNRELIDNIGIPESGDGVDDRLQEARYELDWMLKMQAESGGVYHKVTGRNFPGFVKPQEETDEMLIAPVSNTASSDFAGVLALGARIFTECGSPELAGLSEGYTAAAERAWAYLEEHRDAPGFTNPADIVTGEYPDSKDGDERFWAAAELARTTGKEIYRNTAAELLSSGEVTAELGWVEMGGYGLYALLTDPQLSEDDSEYAAAKALLSERIRQISSGISANAYGIDRIDQFEWGSNMGIANDGVLLMMGALILDDETLRTEAARQLDYLLGENAVGYCFVTGLGSKSPLHPHHRPSTAFGALVPGMLVGGPDSSLEDPYAQNVLAGCSPAKCYADSDQSYSTNEVCVYWNSPLILLISALTA